MFDDLEAPGALLAAAARLATAHREILLMVTGPDDTSVQMINSSLVSLAGVGLRRHTLVIADSWSTCERMAPPCYWTSRTLRDTPSSSVTNSKFWDWRFRFYFIKKRYMAQLVRGGYSVLQADTDTVWSHNPLPVLRAMEGASVVCMADGPIANAGVVYLRPGSAAALALIEDVAWRVQLFQFWPEVVPKLVPFATPPFYANSDDQTILNDAIVSAVLGLRTFLSSTARFEAKNRYNPRSSYVWEGSPLAQQWSRQLHETMRRAVPRHVHIPWTPKRKYTYPSYPLAGTGNDSVAIAPRVLFAHLPFEPHNAMTHLTGARGFRAKVAVLKGMGAWHPEGQLASSTRKLWKAARAHAP